MILQMLPISLHGDLVPKEIKRWNRLERFFLLSFTNLFFPTLPFRAERGRDDRDRSLTTRLRLVSRPRDQETTGSGDENGLRRADKCTDMFFSQMARLVKVT